MRQPYTIDNKTVIHCSHCLAKLRVPTDKGKVSVTCPACRREFMYNPNSILHTLKQIGLYGIARLPKKRRDRGILLAVAIVILIVLLFLIFRQAFPKKTEPSPGPMVFETRQELLVEREC